MLVVVAVDVVVVVVPSVLDVCGSAAVVEEVSDVVVSITIRWAGADPLRASIQKYALSV